MLDIKVLIREFLSVNGETPSAVVVREVATLGHEVLNHPVESAARVRVLVRIIAGAEGPEILSRLWYIVGIQLTTKQN